MVLYKNYEDGLPHLENWIKTQSHIPQCIETQVLIHFLKVCNGDLEKTKKLIDTNYTMRMTYPNIFLERDPCCSETIKQLEAETTLELPGVTPEGNKVFIYKLEDYTPEKFNFTECVKIFIMIIDIRALNPDEPAGQITIFDMSGYTLKHLYSTSISTIRIFLKFLQEALTVQLKEIHVINCAPFVDKVLTIIKPFMRNDIFKMIKFHQPNTETLYNYIPKDMMPNDYGGNGGDMKDLKKQWINGIQNKREYLTNKKYWEVVADKIKKQKPTSSQQNNEMEGNFKSLNID